MMTLAEIRQLVEQGQYSVWWDAVLHALEEGFTAEPQAEYIVERLTNDTAHD